MQTIVPFLLTLTWIIRLKAVLTKNPRGGYPVVHFSEELPLLIVEVPIGRYRGRSVLSRAANLERLAAEIAHQNSGRFRLELVDAVIVYHEFLSDLFLINGLESVRDAERYRMELAIGVCFETESVCRAVADVVQQHFYPECELQFESRLLEIPSKPGEPHVHV